MAKVRVLYTKSATHGVTAINGLRELSWNISSIDKEFGSDGEPVESEATNFRISGEAVFEDVQSYNTALGGAEANLVVEAAIEAGGADRTITIKNVTFRGTRGNVPTRQDPGVGQYRCDWVAVPGSSDTIDAMITEA